MKNKDDRKHLDKGFVKRLGLSLYIYRLYRKIKLTKICERLEINPSTFCSYENGRREIDVQSLVEVSERYRVPVRKLAKENPIDFLRDVYRAEKNADEKKRIGDIIISVSRFVDENGGAHDYSEWWANDITSLASEVFKDRVKENKK